MCAAPDKQLLKVLLTGGVRGIGRGLFRHFLTAGHDESKEGDEKGSEWQEGLTEEDTAWHPAGRTLRAKPAEGNINDNNLEDIAYIAICVLCIYCCDSTIRGYSMYLLSPYSMYLLSTFHISARPCYFFLRWEIRLRSCVLMNEYIPEFKHMHVSP